MPNTNTEPPEVVITTSSVGTSQIKVIADTPQERTDALTALARVLPTIELLESVLRNEFPRS
jgi:hypothetical protein